jgi:ABC-2 type transport system permease protein
MLIKEFIQVFRDPRMRTVVFVIPCVQTLVISYAVTLDVDRVATAVYDRDGSEDSREWISRFTGSGHFEVVEHVDSDQRAQELIDRGRVSTLLRIDPGFMEDLRAGRTARLQVIVDGTDSNTAAVVMSYASRIAAAASEQIVLERLERTTGHARDASLVDLEPRAWFNENLESRNFFVPGVIVIVVTLVTLLLTSMAVVREKEIGTMEQILVTPITPGEFILGKTVPFALIGFVDVTLVTLVGTLWFGVPIRGNLGLLYFATGLYLMTTLGAGLYISTVSQTQQQAMMSTFFFFFPAMLLSGFAFPIANMPQVVQWLTLANPLRWFLVIVRAIFLKGVGPEVLWREMAALAILGTTILGLVIGRFRKTLA